jgi:uncharacterized membrane protein YphA (DoxX/SURF4 family)
VEGWLMTRTTKVVSMVVLGLIATLAAIVVTVIFLSRNVIIHDPAKIKEVSSKIAAYAVPSGYQE